MSKLSKQPRSKKKRLMEARGNTHGLSAGMLASQRKLAVFELAMIQIKEKQSLPYVNIPIIKVLRSLYTVDQKRKVRQ